MTALKSYKRSAVHAVEDITDRGAANALGWVSIGIGLTELAAAKPLTRFMGVEGRQNEGIARTLGVRELMHGADLLSHRDPTLGMWSRVAGDVLDGVLLAGAATRTRRPGGLMTIATLVLPVVLADFLFAKRLSSGRA